MLVADEQTKEMPITIAGGGPLVRIYTVHGDEAIEHDDADEADLSFDPTNSDGWTLTLPASGADVAVVAASVAEAPHVEVNDVDAGPADDARTAAKTGAPTVLEVDLRELERP
jgi:hypothetical protein